MKSEGRREFITSFISKTNEVINDIQSDEKSEATLIRPPYNQNESLFEECKACSGECADVCEESIIVILEDSSPSLDFSSSGCTFCDECAKVCESLENEVIDEDVSVLSVSNILKKISVEVSIVQDSCLAWNKTMCFSCKEPCLENAIIFNGLYKPVIDSSKCTSCGFCISRCPTDAIKLS